mmetsp:Transcript_20104/g.28147  ORF Transcript_20104/g.28147 Transcript_20104/m.28147 type:complete len:251 (+) Transcript_20104:2064-2816(+)
MACFVFHFSCDFLDKVSQHEFETMNSDVINESNCVGVASVFKFYLTELHLVCNVISHGNKMNESTVLEQLAQVIQIHEIIRSGNRCWSLFDQVTSCNVLEVDNTTCSFTGAELSKGLDQVLCSGQHEHNPVTLCSGLPNVISSQRSNTTGHQVSISSTALSAVLNSLRCQEGAKGLQSAGSSGDLWESINVLNSKVVLQALNLSCIAFQILKFVEHPSTSKFDCVGQGQLPEDSVLLHAIVHNLPFRGLE